MKPIKIVVLLALSVQALLAQPENTLLMVEASTKKPFRLFVESAILLPCPPLSTDGSMALKDPREPKILEAIVNQITNTDINSDKLSTEQVKVVYSDIFKLRKWISEKTNYGNQLISAGCDFYLAESLIRNLKLSRLSPQEVKMYVEEIKKLQMPISEIIKHLEKEMPAIVTLKGLSKDIEEGRKFDLLAKAREISTEQNLLYIGAPEKLGEYTNIGGLILLQVSQKAQLIAVDAIVEYIIRGGSMSLNSIDLEADLKRKIPDLLDRKSDGMGLPAIDSLGLVLLITDVK